LISVSGFCIASFSTRNVGHWIYQLMICHTFISQQDRTALWRFRTQLALESSGSFQQRSRGPVVPRPEPTYLRFPWDSVWSKPPALSITEMAMGRRPEASSSPDWHVWNCRRDVPGEGTAKIAEPCSRGTAAIGTEEHNVSCNPTSSTHFQGGLRRGASAGFIRTGFCWAVVGGPPAWARFARATSDTCRQGPVSKHPCRRTPSASTPRTGPCTVHHHAIQRPSRPPADCATLHEGAQRHGRGNPVDSSATDTYDGALSACRPERNRFRVGSFSSSPSPSQRPWPPFALRWPVQGVHGSLVVIPHPPNML
jgi:hypothetical protein